MSLWLRWCLCLRRDTWSQSTTAICALLHFALCLKHCWSQERLQSDVIEIFMQIVKMVILLVGASQHFTCVNLASKCWDHLKPLSFYHSAHSQSQISALNSSDLQRTFSLVFGKRLCFATSSLAFGGLLERMAMEHHGWRRGGWIKELSNHLRQQINCMQQYGAL